MLPRSDLQRFSLGVGLPKRWPCPEKRDNELRVASEIVEERPAPETGGRHRDRQARQPCPAHACGAQDTSIIAKAPDKSAQAVTDALLTALQLHADLVHTLTYDNGKEFAYHQTVAEGLDTQGYFAHPYHSWKPGLNENTNGLIRQYLPKGSDFHSRARRSAASMDKLNNRPRKCLGSKTPNQLFSEINPPVALTSSIRAPKDLKSSE